MPEIIPRGNEAKADKSPVLLFAYGSHKALDGLRRHLIEKSNGLAGQEGLVHHDKRAVGTHKLGKRLQINSFAFWHLATYF